MFKRRYRKNPLLIRELPKRNHFITYIKSKKCFPIYRFTDKRNIKGQTLNVYKKRKVNYRLKYKAKRYIRRNLYIVNRYHNRPYKRRFYRIKRILRKISKKRKAKNFLRATFWRKASNYLIRLKQRVKRIIQRTTDYVVKRRLKRNYHMKSYLKRFILKRTFNKRFFFPIVGPKRPIHTISWEKRFNKIRYKIRKHERYLRYKFFYKPAPFYKPLSKRKLSFGSVNINLKRRNIFGTVFLKRTSKFRRQDRVIFRSTAGCVGYSGRKKKTRYAREKLCNTIADFMATKRISHIDISFRTGYGRMYRFLVKGIILHPIFVRYILIVKKRSHGFTRRRKAKRK